MMSQLIEENKKNILKDNDRIEQIYNKIDESIITETKKSKAV